MNATMTASKYPGRVWTCNEHHELISLNLDASNIARAKEIIKEIHPKKGNKCRECARLYLDTPPSNR